MLNKFEKEIIEKFVITFNDNTKESVLLQIDSYAQENDLEIIRLIVKEFAGGYKASVKFAVKGEWNEIYHTLYNNRNSYCWNGTGLSKQKSLYLRRWNEMLNITLTDKEVVLLTGILGATEGSGLEELYMKFATYLDREDKDFRIMADDISIELQERGLIDEDELYDKAVKNLPYNNIWKEK